MSHEDSTELPDAADQGPRSDVMSIERCMQLNRTLRDVFNERAGFKPWILVPYRSWLRCGDGFAPETGALRAA